MTICDPSDFAPTLQARGEEIGGYRVLRAQSATVPNAIAAFLLYLRDRTGHVPHAYFTWTEGNPFSNVLRYLLFGEGDIAPLVHEVLRQSEPTRCGGQWSTSREQPSDPAVADRSKRTGCSP